LLGGGEGDSAHGLPGSSGGLLVAAGGKESHGGGDEVEGVLLPEVLGLDAGNDQTLEEKLIHFTKPKLLVVDELGYLPFEANAAHLFFQLVSRRYERGSMLVTSNRSVSEWGAVFGDAVVATAILDRLLHHSHVITIRGDSYRLRTKRRAGLVNQASAEPATQTD
jgi:hypothetical protein